MSFNGLDLVDLVFQFSFSTLSLSVFLVSIHYYSFAKLIVSFLLFRVFIGNAY